MKKLIVRFLKWYFREELWRFYSLETEVNNSGVKRDRDIYMLRARIHTLERCLGVSNSFHHAEIAHPDDGFAWFESWALKKDTAVQAIKREMKKKHKTTEHEQ